MGRDHPTMGKTESQVGPCPSNATGLLPSGVGSIEGSAVVLRRVQS